jgi:hypothetical protein
LLLLFVVHHSSPQLEALFKKLVGMEPIESHVFPL